MAHDKETTANVIDKLKTGKPCNEAKDGLKFFGRINNCRKRMATEANGTRRTSFTVNAAGFTELDASIYTDPHFDLPQAGAMAKWLNYFGLAVGDLITKSNGSIETDVIIPAIYNLMYSNGLPKNANVTLGANTKSVTLTEGLDNPNAFIMPTEVGSVFGVTTGTKPGNAVGWNNIMELIHGVQKFSTSDDSSNLALMAPSAPSSTENLNIKFTGQKMMGKFVPQLPSMAGLKTVWSLMSQFVNLSVNEMFTALKVNSDGKIVPTLTIRQLPFSSGIISDTLIPEDPLSPEERKQADTLLGQLDLARDSVQRGEYKNDKGFSKINESVIAKWKKRTGKNAEDLKLKPTEIRTAVTRMAEVPRWKIDPILVKAFDVGRSDAMRHNFVHVYGESGAPTGLSPAQQFVKNPPIIDDLDVARSGLRPFMATVACAPDDLVNGGPAAWMDLLADIVVNQELTLTGIMNVHGITSPIAPGDNIEYDGVIAHLEAVNHVFSIAPSGHVSFLTNLEFTHGVSAVQMDNQDKSMFIGLDAADISTFDPAVSQDGNGQTEGTNQKTPDLTKGDPDFANHLKSLLLDDE
jgi:hypothetical protein